MFSRIPFPSSNKDMGTHGTRTHFHIHPPLFVIMFQKMKVSQTESWAMCLLALKWKWQLLLQDICMVAVGGLGAVRDWQIPPHLCVFTFALTISHFMLILPSLWPLTDGFKYRNVSLPETLFSSHCSEFNFLSIIYIWLIFYGKCTLQRDLLDGLTWPLWSQVY